MHGSDLALVGVRSGQDVQVLAVKGGVKLDHWGGGKLDQMSVWEMGIGREGGVWSGGLRSGLQTAFRPERKTPPSARDVVVI